MDWNSDEAGIAAAADRYVAEFFERELGRYRELVRAAKAHPENRNGSDKTWVERAMRNYQRHYRNARRVE